MLNLTPENAQTIFTELASEKTVLVNFYSAQSPDAVMLFSNLENITSQHQDTIALVQLDCDAQPALASQLAQQLGLQGIPATLVLQNGTPVDVIMGAPELNQLKDKLSAFLPNPVDDYLESAKKALLAGDKNDAYANAKKAYELEPSTKVKLVLADICIQMKKRDDAKTLLESIQQSEQDPYCANLMMKLERSYEESESDEIKALKEALVKSPDDLSLLSQLAKAYLREEDIKQGLSVMHQILATDLNFEDVKASYLATINSLPEGDPLASEFRKKLYSLLY